ncbi:proteasome-type protease [Pseudomonas sp. S9]|uniref:proteasome-type protease n=1 Tax=Pseudomonas sp. S9 TaxID=686578 RepID=UPI0002557183|nr:proteasome-type protease [Pseudomonas sp. S9]
MTYCVGISLEQGLVFVSDSRTNAGVDHIATFRKLHVFGVPGERIIVLQTAGNLATSQSVISLLQQRLNGEGANLNNVPSLYQATTLVSETMREVMARDGNGVMMQGVDLSCSFIVGGQVNGEAAGLFNIYPQGNFIAATEDTPYFQIGESKYGKPVLDRSLDNSSSLQHALLTALISFDSTIRSNLSVGMPLDVLVYNANSLQVPNGFRVTQDDPYYQGIRQQWGEALQRTLLELPPAPGQYLG